MPHYSSFAVSDPIIIIIFFFFFNDTPTTEIYTLSLHDALPIYHQHHAASGRDAGAAHHLPHHHSGDHEDRERDRKSTRLNSSHTVISYAVFCLKKKKEGRGDI